MTLGEPKEFTLGLSSLDQLIRVDLVLSNPEIEEKKWDFDIDADGVSDFRIASSNEEPPSYFHNPNYSIMSLNDAFEFNGVIKDDTTYYNKDVIVENESDGSTLKRITHLYKCERSSLEDQVYHINQRQLFLTSYAKGQVMENDNHFQSDTIYLTNHRIITPREEQTIADTNFVNLICRDLICEIIPQEELIYLAVKKENRLGWIRLGVFSSDEIYISEMLLEE